MINPLAERTVEVKILNTGIRIVMKVRVFSPIEGEPIFFKRKRIEFIFRVENGFFRD